MQKPLIPLGRQSLRMPPQMILDEGGDEEVGMVVTLLIAQGQREACGGAGLFEPFPPELALQKAIGRSLIDQDVRHPCPIGNQRAGIVGAPSIPVGSEITRERLLAPG